MIINYTKIGKLIILCVFLCLGIQIVYSQPIKKKKQLFNPAQFGATPEEQFIALRQLAYGNKQIGKYEEAYFYFKEAFRAFDQIKTAKSKNATGANFQQMNQDYGQVCDTLGTREAAINHKAAAFDYLKDAILPYLWAENQWAVFGIQKKLADLSLTYVQDDKYENALQKYRHLLKLIRINDPEVIMAAFSEMATIYWDKGAIDTAVITLDSSFKKLKDPKYAPLIYTKIADFYIQRFQNTKDTSVLNYALEHFTNSITQAQSPILQANMYLKRGDIGLQMGKRGSFYKDYSEAINIFKAENHTFEAAKASFIVASKLFDAEEYEKAQTYINEAQEAIKELQDPQAVKLKVLINDLAKENERMDRLDKLEGKSAALDVQLENKERIYRNIAIGGLLLLLVIAFASYISKKNANLLLHRQNEEINRQKKEIEMQKDNIEQQKNLVETSYRNIKALSEIGQKITSTLDIAAIIDIAHQCFVTLVSTDKFSVGLYNDKYQKVEFIQSIEKDKKIPSYTLPISPEKQSLYNCIIYQKEILISDIEVQGVVEELSLNGTVQSEGSALLLPLSVEASKVGLIVVQTTKKNAYTQRDLVLIHTLSSYMSIAIANAKAYEIIDTKNKHILDSIRYGETIQQAVLPDKDKIRDIVGEYFVLFKPKDMVSGDFYWITQVGDKKIVAIIDCTGHGVPGAFMSMIGNTLLNEIVNQNKITNPAHILELLHLGVRKALRQAEESGKANDDGMDVALCSIEPFVEKEYKIVFAGAKRPMNFIRKPYLHIEEIKGDAKPIGGMQKEEKRIFSNTEMILQQGDLIYLYSDGYPDQNNPDRKKFGSNQMKTIILENAHKPLLDQKYTLALALADYQGEAEQRDDITILAWKLA